MIHRLSVLLLLLTTGCATTYQQGPDYDVRTPLRAAILPFADHTGQSAVLSAPFTAALDKIPLTSRKFQDTPATMLRHRVLANLRRTRLDLLHPGIVDQNLQHHHLYDAQALTEAPATDVGRFLGADLLIYGDLLGWSRDYYVLEAKVSVLLRLRIVDVQTGRIVYETQQEARKMSGVSGGPTSIGGAIISPITGLSNRAFTKLTNEIARKVVEPLISPEDQIEDGEEPPYVAAAHIELPKHRAPTSRLLSVYLIGSPNCQAHFRLGPTGRRAPLTELAPGRYRGQLLLEKGEQADQTTIEVVLLRAGRRTTARIFSTP